MSEPTTAEICDCASTGPDAINTCQRVIRGRVESPCDCECHKPTREQKCRDLARAMFPTAVVEPSSRGNGVDIRIYDKPNETRSWYDFDPFTDHADCHDLVVWLATQGDKFWGVFSGHLLDATMPFELQEYGDFEDLTLAALTAEPAVIAEAAWRAIQPSK